MAGVTDSGFDKKSREEILSDMENLAQNYFGDDINLAENSPLGMILKLFSFIFATVWNTLSDLYNSFYINTATGQQLDDLVAYLGLERLPAARAGGTVTFSGDEGVEIPEGFLVETDSSDPIQFETTESGTIDSSGTLDLDINAVEAGEEGNVSSNTITVIVNPLSGLNSVTNADPTTGGRDRETDNQLRQRYKNSTDLAGGGTLTAIRANVLQATEASACFIRENTNLDLNYDTNNIPPRAIEPLVLAPTGTEIDEDIAEAIFNKLAAGIPSIGNTTVTITDDAGQSKDIGFTRGTGVDVYIEFELTTTDDFPSNGTDLIEEDAINYIDNLSLGDDVIQSKLIDIAYNTEGVKDVEVFLDTSSSPTSTSNITIANDEVAVTDTNKVTFTIL